MTIKKPHKHTSATVTYNYLKRNAEISLERAKKEKQGGIYNCLTSILSSVLMVEAYLNHLGENEFEIWDKNEKLKRLGWRKKLKAIGKFFDYEIDLSHQPYQTLISMFEFRNQIAHGRTEILEYRAIPIYDDYGNPTFNETNWISLCNVNDAEKFLEAGKQVVFQLHEKSGLEGEPFGVLSYFSLRK